MGKKNAHLIFDDRLTIQQGLNEGKSFKEIANIVGKDPTTISKEVRNHYIINSATNNCANFKNCKFNKICSLSPSYGCYSYCKRCKKVNCNEICNDFVKAVCKKITKPPYVCNGCTDRKKCKCEKHFYDAKAAQKEYKEILSDSRCGISINSKEIQRIDDIISPLIKQGQSLHHICVTHADEIMIDERTLYNYIDLGVFSISNIDLPRKVRYRARKKKKSVKIDKQCYFGRTYDDFNEFLECYNDNSYVEIDSVEGIKGGKVLLTIHFVGCSFMLAYLRDANTAKSVSDIFDKLDIKLGREDFKKLFNLIITDRGSEFSNPTAIECDKEGEIRTRIFYCDPNRSDQKGSCEVNHEFIRRVLPKGTSFNDLTQKDITKMMNHINSYKRKKLNNRSPFELFSLIYGEDIVEKLQCKAIPVSDINITPMLLKK